MGSPGGLVETRLDTDVASKPPIELYLVRLSPPCRIVWLYMLQVTICFLFMKRARLQGVYMYHAISNM